MDNLIDVVKDVMGYRTKVLGCKDCAYFKEDMTTDNFGPGDMCTRNPDCTFRTDAHACCNKIKAKSN